MNSMQAGSPLRIGIRAVVIYVVSTLCLYFYYRQFSITQDPLTSTTIASVVAAYDNIVHWLFPETDIKALQKMVNDRDVIIAQQKAAIESMRSKLNQAV